MHIHMHTSIHTYVTHSADPKFCQLTSGKSNKNTKYTTEKHYNYFIYIIKLLHQVHYPHLTVRL